MSNFLRALPERERCALYRVTLARYPEPGPEGLAYELRDGHALLGWDALAHVIAAEIGEPEGVRTIVFDLVARRDEGWEVLRLDAEPGQEATDLAQAIEHHAEPATQSASLKSIATDGIPSLWFPDLASFEEDTLAQLG